MASFVQALPGFAALDERTQSDAIAAAWLHDVLEDTDETVEGPGAVGILGPAISAVITLTRTAAVTGDNYYAGIATLPLARLVKTADLASNLAPERVAQLDQHTRGRLARKYAHALEVLGVDRSVIITLHEGRFVQ